MTTYENYEPNVNNENNFNNLNNANNEIYDNTEQLNYIYKVQDLYNNFVSQDRYTPKKYPSYYNQQIEKPVIIQPDQSYVSLNQNLVGNANPKTKIRPVVAPPTHDWEYWRGNDFVFPNKLNERSIQDYYNSGYYIDEDVDCPPRKNKLVIKNNGDSGNGYTPTPKPTNVRKEMIKEEFNYNMIKENYENPKNSNNYLPFSGEKEMEKSSCKSCTGGGYDLPPKNFKKENGDFTKVEEKPPAPIEKRFTGDLNDACSYDPTNLNYNLPSNYTSTNCQRRQDLSELNGQVFTSTIVPGVYYKNQIIEPISSNIGISFTQQVPPRKVSYDKDGNKIYTALDPRLYTPDTKEVKEIDVPSNYDVYDPRTNGYGTQYRSYVDKMTGQPRFYYDDINAIRRPNYIARSDIDFMDKADSYGPIKEDEEEIDITENIRKNVEYAYLDNTIDFRTDMMTRLMRPANARLWQKRMAPITGLKK
jgi:hypothetical protein